LDQRVAHQIGQQADRHVQKEDPAPAVVVGDKAAERRPDHRREWLLVGNSGSG
jgi:hypothetical protein